MYYKAVRLWPLWFFSLLAFNFAFSQNTNTSKLKSQKLNSQLCIDWISPTPECQHFRKLQLADSNSLVCSQYIAKIPSQTLDPLVWIRAAFCRDSLTPAKQKETVHRQILQKIPLDLTWWVEILRQKRNSREFFGGALLANLAEDLPQKNSPLHEELAGIYEVIQQPLKQIEHLLLQANQEPTAKLSFASDVKIRSILKPLPSDSASEIVHLLLQNPILNTLQTTEILQNIALRSGHPDLAYQIWKIRFQKGWASEFPESFLEDLLDQKAWSLLATMLGEPDITHHLTRSLPYWMAVTRCIDEGKQLVRANWNHLPIEDIPENLLEISLLSWIKSVQENLTPYQEEIPKKLLYRMTNSKNPVVQHRAFLGQALVAILIKEYPVAATHFTQFKQHPQRTSSSAEVYYWQGILEALSIHWEASDSLWFLASRYDHDLGVKANQLRIFSLLEPTPEVRSHFFKGICPLAFSLTERLESLERVSASSPLFSYAQLEALQILLIQGKKEAISLWAQKIQQLQLPPHFLNLSLELQASLLPLDPLHENSLAKSRALLLKLQQGLFAEFARQKLKT